MKEKCVEEELSEDNLHKFNKSIVVMSEGQLDEGNYRMFVENLKLMRDLSNYIARQNKDRFDNKKVFDILGVKSTLEKSINEHKERIKPYLADMMMIRDNLNVFLSQYGICQTEESLVSDEKEEDFSNNEEMYNYYLDKAIEKIKTEFKEGKTDSLREEDKTDNSLESRAERDVKNYIWSFGEAKICPPKNMNKEIYKAVKELYEREKNRVTHILPTKKEDLSEKVDLSKKDKLNEYLDGVSEIVLQTDSKTFEKEKKKRTLTKEEEEVTTYTTN